MAKQQSTKDSGNKEKRKDNRRTFSVSKRFSGVHDILDSLPESEMSRFICEAINHYHQVTSNPDWMSDQLQQIMKTQAQLQQMIAGFGSVAFPNQLSPVQPMFQQQHVLPSQQIPNPYANQMYPASGYVSPTLTEHHPPSLPVVETGETPTVQQTVTHAIEQITTDDEDRTEENTHAVEHEQRFEKYTEDSQEETQTTVKRPRKKSKFAQALTDKSLGKIDKK
ncbi:hypothetical protein SMD22_01570 (plasmid) [Brevibacillus halotolerans]|nr:hypothetical protein SMD22_01570 [Brevibacillus halotolerans]